MYLETICPWKEHLFKIENQFIEENEDYLENQVKFVIYKDEDDKFRIQGIQTTGYHLRLGIKHEYRGL